MTLKTYPLLMNDTTQDACDVLREIIRNREYDVDYINNFVTSMLPIRCYGEMYSYHSSYVVNISAIDTVYEIGGGFSSGLSENVTFGGSHYMTIGKSGRYFASWSVCFETPNPGDLIGAGVLLDGTLFYKGSAHTSVPSASKAAVVSGSLFFDATLGQQVSLGVNNHTATRNITIDSACLTIQRLV